MRDQFHCFGQLPPELRLLIWECAVVDRSVPRVNFFSIREPDDDDGEPGTTRAAFVYLVPPRRGRGCSVPGEMRCYRWEHCTRSSCLGDSSLWEACRESRAVMTSMVARLQRQPDLSSDGGRLRVSTSISTDANWYTRRFTFVPSRDLFVLDFDVFAATYNLCFDIFATEELPGSVANMAHLAHVGLEIDPRWLRGHLDPEAIARSRSAIYQIATLTLSKPKECSVCLIDYRLARGVTGPADGCERSVFRGEGGRFVEMKRGDDYGWDPAIKYEPMRILSPFAFAQWVDDAAQSMLQRGAADSRAGIKLLAWESD
ncbi:hypothetical protein IF1G_09895 [Cordyceps javanica]|uniref:2EXR domain-containing protein n=1 Tax=Cordyceps javanica TaxID=43265 RepID=A0A545UPK2_9HYPO|nr:hypothetical protein IF1G_09895 [Cordyceps javanica]TQW03187.1 hypothetical protein IF2G_09320 [Cordyceps javanica]